MSTATRIVTTGLFLALLAAACRAEEAPEKQWVWLDKQGVWGYGYPINDGPYKGLWRIDPDSKRPPEEPPPAAPADPYGFAEILNGVRASEGLPPVSYDHELSLWASKNNAVQKRRGIGHHVNPNCYQNCAWNSQDAQDAAGQWLNSPDHRANMLASDVSHFGVAFGPGPYWTMNLR